MVEKDKMSRIGKIISSCSLILGGGVLLGGLFMKKKYKSFLEFKEICKNLNNALENENKNKNSTVAPCIIKKEGKIKSTE